MRKPIYLLAGGNWRTSDTLVETFRNIISEVGKKQPRVAYVGAANNDNPSFFHSFRTLLGTAGSSNISQIRLAQDHADIATARSSLGAADAVFIAGGDVDAGMQWLVRHDLVPLMRDLYDQGTLFFGLSAGSIMLGTHWVRWENPDDDSTAELFACMSVAPIVCDTHAEDDEWEELKAAVWLLGTDGRGYGIPTEGGIRVAADGNLTALTKKAICYIHNANRVVKSHVLPVG